MSSRAKLLGTIAQQLLGKSAQFDLPCMSTHQTCKKSVASINCKTLAMCYPVEICLFPELSSSDLLQVSCSCSCCSFAVIVITNLDCTMLNHASFFCRSANCWERDRLTHTFACTCTCKAKAELKWNCLGAWAAAQPWLLGVHCNVYL